MKAVWLRLIVLFLFAGSLTGKAQQLDAYLSSKGMTNVSRLDTTLQVYLLYAHPGNIMGDVVYEGITCIWLRPEAATMLVAAQKELKKLHPRRTLIVYDAARPMSVQRKMWQLVRGTEKMRYVSNPANGGGLHNYGMAVDVSILDENGRPLDMGSLIDHFGLEAHTDQEQSLLSSGRITRQAYENRLLLRNVMRKAGFRTITSEWWHFNACTRAEAIARYPLID